MRSLALERRARSIIGEPWELTMSAHISGLARHIELFLYKLARHLKGPPPDYLLASPDLMCALDSADLSTEDAPSIWGPFELIRTRILAGASQLKLIRMQFDDPDFTLGPGEGWFTYAARYHDLDRARLPAFPVATLQIAELREHPLQRLARCSE